MYTVYVLKSKIALKSYIGFTENMARRLAQHNLGESYYSKRYKPWEVIYTEACESREEARKRERYLKSAAGRKFLKKEVFKN